MKFAIAILPLFILTACYSPVVKDEVGQDEVGQDECGASEYAGIIGKPASIFASMTLPVRTRIIGVGMPVSLDFGAQRLNFDLDENQKIQHVWCG